MKDWFGQKPFENCPISNCLTTNDRNLLNSISDFDAIFFHIRNMEDGAISLPEDRKNKQLYLMFLMESPLNDNFPYERFQNYFNWTMTYRRDSDFYRPYGWVAPKNWTWHYPKDSAEQNWSQYSTNITHSMLRGDCYNARSPKGTCIVNAYCQFSQQACPNFMQTYLYSLISAHFFYNNDQFAL